MPSSSADSAGSDRPPANRKKEPPAVSFPSSPLPSSSSPSLPRRENEAGERPPRIRLLPDEVKSRIAAGEVIERPAGALKELVENALDAGARRVHVEISFGGRNLVRVADDGEGLTSAELPLAVRRHATSKLTCAEQLFSLATLGFRGEALPSIAAVSRLTITSRTRESDAAWRLTVKGGECSEIEPAAGGVGTTVEVHDLFFNLPTRRKFLKSAASEAAACADTMLRLALPRPDVSFTLVQGRRELLDCPAVPGARRQTRSAGRGPGETALEALRRRIQDALGRRRLKELAPLKAGIPAVEVLRRSPAAAGATGGETTWPSAAPTKATTGGYRLYGFVTPPSSTRANRSAVYTAVNGRALRDRILTTALMEAYRRLIPARRYPAAVLFLDVPSEDVDINVHPAKTEVRFRYPSLIFSLFHRAVREAFQLGGPVGQVPPRSAESVAPAAASSAEETPRPAPTSAEKTAGDLPGEEAAATTGPAATAEPAVPPAPPAPTKRAASFAPPYKEERSFDLWRGERVRQVLVSGGALQSPAPRPATTREELPPEESAAARQPAATGPTVPPAQKPAAASVPAPQKANAAADDFLVLGQAGGRYIVLEDENGVNLIDQHALHERVLFETLMARARRGRGDMQQLLLPETLELTPAQAAVFDDEARAVLRDLGFEVEEFGPRAVAVRAVPTVLREASAAGAVADFLDELATKGGAAAFIENDGGKRTATDNPSATEARAALREKAVYVVSCKSAVKAGERLTLEQMTALVREYRRVVGRGAWTCPHGRPVAVELSWGDLAKGVGRR